jgi:hypothetical protein
MFGILVTQFALQKRKYDSIAEMATGLGSLGMHMNNFDIAADWVLYLTLE